MIPQVDLFQNDFWTAMIAGIVLVYGIRHAVSRKWAWAIINTAFLASLVGGRHAAILLVATAGMVGAIRVGGPGKKALTAMTVGIVAAIVFITYKWPVGSGPLPAWRVAFISPLVSIGFSYVFLRLVDMLREVRDSDRPLPDLPATINYLLPFHMLAAGPIQSYGDFIRQDEVASPLSAWDVLGGAERIVFGLFKKFVLAAAIHRMCLTGFRAEGWWFLLEVQLTLVWLYLDFSAYSDIAVGVGRLMGVATPENFNRPFLARNIINFWERWHMSLSLWIRRNMFTPMQLGMMRRTRGRYSLLCASAAFMTAFIFCGLWHRANLPFLLWGAYQAAGLVAVNLYRSFLLKRKGAAWVKQYMANRPIAIISGILTFEFVAFSLVPLMGTLEQWVQ